MAINLPRNDDFLNEGVELSQENIEVMEENIRYLASKASTFELPNNGFQGAMLIKDGMGCRWGEVFDESKYYPITVINQMFGSSIINDISDLITNDKTGVIPAINELKSTLNSLNVGDISQGVTNINEEIENIKKSIGGVIPFTPPLITKIKEIEKNIDDLNLNIENIKNSNKDNEEKLNLSIDEVIKKTVGRFNAYIENDKPTAVDGGEIFNDYENNHADGNYSHAEGRHSISNGISSHAGGSYCSALGENCYAYGRNIVAGAVVNKNSGIYNYGDSNSSSFSNIGLADQFIIGKNNISYDGLLFAIGNGSDSKNRSNIFEAKLNEININSNTNITGDINLGGNITGDFIKKIENRIKNIEQISDISSEDLNSIIEKINNFENIKNDLTENLGNIDEILFFNNIFTDLASSIGLRSKRTEMINAGYTEASLNSIADSLIYVIKNANNSSLTDSVGKRDDGGEIFNIYDGTNSAKFNHSSSFGIGNITNASDQFVCGRYSNPKITDLFAVGCGLTSTNRENAMAINSSGNLFLKGYIVSQNGTAPEQGYILSYNNSKMTWMKPEEVSNISGTTKSEGLYKISINNGIVKTANSINSSDLPQIDWQKIENTPTKVIDYGIEDAVISLSTNGLRYQIICGDQEPDDNDGRPDNTIYFQYKA